MSTVAASAAAERGAEGDATEDGTAAAAGIVVESAAISWTN
jgi:hypothetical protein